VIVVGIGSFALVLAVAYLVGRPFLVPEADGHGEAQFADDRRRIAAQLRDLDMEFATEKLAEDEYRTQRASRMAELDAAETELAELRTLDHEPEAEIAEPFDEAIEARIAARRRALERTACPACGAEVGGDDRFCRSCGAELSQPETR
jgi:zinc ribbon protein